MVVSDEYLHYAFKTGTLAFASLGEVQLFAKELPPLPLPSGRIVACDPLAVPHAEPLDVEVAPGEYPVVLTIAEFGNDQRVAFARLQLAPGTPTSWRHVGQAGQDVAALADDQYFGYPVDSGTACFMDPRAARALLERMDRDDRYYETLIAQMEKTYVDTWSWAMVPLDARSRLAVACFSSGDGDGFYGTYLGLDTNGKVICVVTDFQVFDVQ